MSDSNSGSTRHRDEILWLVISLIGLAALFGLSIWRLQSGPGRVPSTPQKAPVKQILGSPMFKNPGVVKLGPNHYRVSVVARQYQFQPSKIVVPVNARVDFYVTSGDVVHGFIVTGTDINLEVFPGYVAHVYATFHTAKKFLLACDQYCGIGHQNMTGAVNVVAKMPAKNSNASPSSGQNGSSSLAEAGKSIFKSHCAACHQASGKGVPGTFPPLVHTIPTYQKSAKKRQLLPQVLLYGLKGKIEANGKSYNGHMPAWGSKLNDKQIAEVLDYIATAWGNEKEEPPDFKPYQPDEIKSMRGKNLTPHDVWQARQKLFSTASNNQ